MTLKSAWRLLRSLGGVVDLDDPRLDAVGPDRETVEWAMSAPWVKSPMNTAIMQLLRACLRERITRLRFTWAPADRTWRAFAHPPRLGAQTARLNTLGSGSGRLPEPEPEGLQFQMVLEVGDSDQIEFEEIAKCLRTARVPSHRVLLCRFEGAVRELRVTRVSRELIEVRL